MAILVWYPGGVKIRAELEDLDPTSAAEVKSIYIDGYVVNVRPDTGRCGG
jgi:hypothetical protein